MTEHLVMQEEPIHERLEEAKPLLALHWNEVALHQDTRPLDPDWDFYVRLSKAGTMRAFVARLDGTPVGYAVYVIAAHPHYKTWRIAKNDLYWIDPKFRHHGIGSRLFLTAEDWLRNTVRCHMVVYPVKSHLNPNGDLFRSIGYDLVEICFEKVLQNPPAQPPGA